MCLISPPSSSFIGEISLLLSCFDSGSRSYPTSCFYSDSHHLRGLPGSFPGASQVQSQRDASGIHVWCHLSSLSEGRVCSLIYIQCTRCFCSVTVSMSVKRKARASWDSAAESFNIDVLLITEWGGRISHRVTLIVSEAQIYSNNKKHIYTAVFKTTSKVHGWSRIKTFKAWMSQIK